MNRGCWICLLAIYFFAHGAFAAVEEQPSTIRLSCWIPAEQPLYRDLEALYTAAFNQLGYQLVMTHRPAQRSLFEAESGLSDGECAREEDFLKVMPDSRLVKVDAIVRESELSVWSRDSTLRINGIVDLLQKDYRIGYMRGNKTFANLADLYKIPNTQEIASAEIGMRMLSANRIDLFIHVAIVISPQMEAATSVYSVGSLMSLRGYLYLHPRHTALAEPLAEVLTRLMSVDEHTP